MSLEGCVEAAVRMQPRKVLIGRVGEIEGPASNDFSIRLDRDGEDLGIEPAKPGLRNEGRIEAPVGVQSRDLITRCPAKL